MTLLCLHLLPVVRKLLTLTVHLCPCVRDQLIEALVYLDVDGYGVLKTFLILPEILLTCHVVHLLFLIFSYGHL